MIDLLPYDDETTCASCMCMPSDNVTGAHLVYVFNAGSSKELEIPIIKEKIRCYFTALVLFLLIYKGILPIHKNNIRMDEVPFGFG